MKFKKIILSILLIAILINSIGQSVKAVTNEIIDLTKKASLTITRYEYINNSSEKTAFKGVGISVYTVPSDMENVTSAQNYVENNNLEPKTATTGNDGVAKFTDLNLGRYLVVETNTPKNALSKMESFLIDLPRSNDNGTWNYDVKVYPKTSTIYGKVILTHKTDEGEPLKDATWKLQKKDNSGDWKNYEDVGSLTTDSNGQISIENLEKGEYRFVQISVTDGYILDSSNTVNFAVDENNLNKNLTAQSEKLDIEHYVKLSDNTYGSQVGAFETDTISWKTTAEVASIISKMDKYAITEILDDNLIFNESSLKVYGDSEELNLNSDYKININGQEITIDFIKGKLEGYSNVTVKYDTTFDVEKTKSGVFKTYAQLEYTNKIKVNGENDGTFKTQKTKADVYTGAVLIYKTDIDSNPLSGAKFKIATSKSNAEDGIFVKDTENEDIVATSDEKGYVIFNGLKLGNDNQSYEQALTSYWIVEVQAPTYEEDGEIRYYNLLSSPVEVQVSSKSGTYSEESTTQVINKKGLKLPLTGGVLNIIPLVAGIMIITIYIIIKKKENRNEEKETKQAE